MSPNKRTRDHSIDAKLPGLPPAKIARQIASLKIDDKVDTEDLKDEMEGIEARDFTHVTRQDFEDTINEIEIDDRFLKIPEHITAATNPSEDSRNQSSKALILYESQPKQATWSNTDKQEQYSTSGSQKEGSRQSAVESDLQMNE